MIETNLKTVHEHMMNEAADPDSVMGLYTDDIVLEMPARDIRLDNKADISANYRATFGSMADIELNPLDRFATEDRVVDDMLVRFTLTGDGLKNLDLPIGSRVELRLVHIFHMRDGKIAREIVHENYRVLGA